MSGLNRYYRRSHISEKKFRLLLRYFAMDLSASQTSVLSGISRRAANSVFLKIRAQLVTACQAASPFSNSEVEVDESYFGARRVRGKRASGHRANISSSASTNATVLSLPKSFPMCKRKRCKPLFAVAFPWIQWFTRTAGAATMDWLMSGSINTICVNHSKNEFVLGDSHINGIESFWSYAKRRLQKFNGISKHTFYLHLKECEWRFNNRSKNLYLELLKLLRENPL